MTFSERSLERLSTCHADLQLVMNTAIGISRVDFGIAEGHRSVERQTELYKKGFSQKDGIAFRSKHNYEPSRAVDIYSWVNGMTNYRLDIMTYLAGLIEGTSEILYAAKQINHRVRWGGNWDMDGEIITDQTFIDTPHYELI